jgi:hypothetical protein
MPQVLDLREDLLKCLRKHGLVKKRQKAKELFENDPSHLSLNTELLEPKHRLLYSFRIDRKYLLLFRMKSRAIFSTLRWNLISSLSEIMRI